MNFLKYNHHFFFLQTNYEVAFIRAIFEGTWLIIRWDYKQQSVLRASHKVRRERIAVELLSPRDATSNGAMMIAVVLFMHNVSPHKMPAIPRIETCYVHLETHADMRDVCWRLDYRAPAGWPQAQKHITSSLHSHVALVSTWMQLSASHNYWLSQPEPHWSNREPACYHLLNTSKGSFKLPSDPTCKCLWWESLTYENSYACTR